LSRAKSPFGLQRVLFPVEAGRIILSVGREGVTEEEDTGIFTGVVVVALSDVLDAISPRNDARMFLVLRFTNCSILLFTGVAVVERSAAETRTGIFISIGRSH